MNRSVSSHMNFREEVAKDGTTYFHKTLFGEEQYTLQDVIAQVVSAIEEIGATPGKSMSILVHVSKHIEGE